MKQYLDLLQHVLVNGRPKGDRTGTGTRQVFGHQMRFDLREGFPLVTTKKVHTKSIIAELLWFLSGSTNVKDLQAMGCTIWDEWAKEDGSLGPIYGAQWRSWLTHTERREHTDERRNRTRAETVGYSVDQIAQLVKALKQNPNDRGHIVSAWNVADLPHMALRPCHAMFQMDVTDGRLSCQLYQRSADLLLGVPFNIASYALLTHMLAQQCNLEVGEFIWTGGDCHIYDNHFQQVQTQLARKPRPLPQLVIKRKPDSIFDYQPDDFEITGYDPHPVIKAPVAV